MAESRDRQGRKDCEIRDCQSSRRECEVPRKELVFNKKPMLAAGHLRPWRRESAAPEAFHRDFWLLLSQPLWSTLCRHDQL